jgi:hypothetical protein
MRVDILANNRASFVRPIAEGLDRMLRDCGAEPRLHYDGLEHLMMRQRIDTSSLRSLAGSTMRLPRSRSAFNSFVDRLRGTDLIIVVLNVPGSFSTRLYPNIELLRSRLPGIPIVNYDLHYLPTLDSWAKLILKDQKTGLSPAAVATIGKRKIGLERYDWYLMASVGSHVPLPEGPQPYTLIGIDLDDGTLYPDQQGRFMALVDFPQPQGHYPAFRKVQLEALSLAKVDFEVLDGPYTTEQIRGLYRRTSVFFLAFAEAFGLPIAEVQGCGSKVFTPDPHWAAAHWLGTDYTSRREPRLSPNFVIYDNDAGRLADLIR